MKNRKPVQHGHSVIFYKFLNSLFSLFSLFFMPKKIDWKAIEKAYRNSNDSPAKLAIQFGVSKRSIELKVDAEGWKAERETKVMKVPPPENAPRRSRGRVDELELVDNALHTIDRVLSGGDTDAKGLGTCASALCRLIEMRLKLQPRTAADLAELAIGLGMSPGDFARELRIAWEKRA